MIATTTNKYFFLEYQPELGETIEIFKDIQKDFMFNEPLSYLINKFNLDDSYYALDDEEKIKFLAQKNRSPAFGHYLAFKYNLLTGSDPFFDKFFKQWDSDNRKFIFGKAFSRYQMWDGLKSFITVRKNSKKIKVGAGLREKILKVLKETHPDVQITYVDKVSNRPVFNAPPSSLGGITFRPTQQQILDAVLGSKDVATTVNAATNTGKTPIIAFILEALDRSKSAVVFYSDSNLFKQGALDYAKTYGIEGLSLYCTSTLYREVKTQFKAEGASECLPPNEEFGRVTLVMIKTLQSRLKKDLDPSLLKNISLGIVDESHKFLAPTYKKTIREDFNFGMLLGLTGTPYNEENIKDAYEYRDMFGEDVATVDNVYNIEQGYSQKPVVTMYSVSGHFNIAYAKTVSERYIYYNEYRYKRLVKRLNEVPDLKTVIMYGYTDRLHGTYLYKKLLLDFPNKKIVYSDGEDSETFDKYRAFREGEIDILVISSILREGINIPNIEHVVNWAATSSKTFILQVILGRAIRVDKSKEVQEVLITDFYDEGSVEYEAASEKRMQVYKDPSNGCTFILE